MPKLGETMTEGTVVRWLAAVGDRVTRDEPIVAIETDKVELEVPAPASGTLASILVASGEARPVGAILAVIDA